MAKIPQYTAQKGLDVARLTKQAPAVMVDPSALAGEARAITQLGQTMAEVGERINRIQAQSELSKANTKAIEGRKTIESTEDIETQGWLERRDKELKDLRQNVLKDIRNPLARQQFELEFDRDVIDTQFRLKTIYTRLNLVDVLNSFHQEKDKAEEEIHSATSEQERQLKIDKIGDRYAEMGKTGAMTVPGALKEFKTWEKGLLEGQVKYDIANNPAFATAELQKGSQGSYKDLPRDKRLDFIKQADTRIEKLKNQEEERVAIAQNQREAEHIEMKIAETLTEEIVLADLEAGLISPKFAEAELKNLRSPKTYKPTIFDKVMKFNELTERAVDIGKKGKFFWSRKASFEELTKFRADVLNANAKDLITNSEMLNLLSEQSEAFYREPIFQNTLEQLAAQSTLYDSSEEQAVAKAEMYNNLIQKVIAGKEPREAVTEVIREKINAEFGEAIKIEKETNRIFATKEDQRIYSEDNGLTWYDEKTNKVIGERFKPSPTDATVGGVLF